MEFNPANCKLGESKSQCASTAYGGYQADQKLCKILIKPTLSKDNYGNNDTFHILYSAFIEGKNSKEHKEDFIKYKYKMKGIYELVCSIEAAMGIDTVRYCDGAVDIFNTHYFYQKLELGSKLCKTYGQKQKALCEVFKVYLADLIKHARILRAKVNKEDNACDCRKKEYDMEYTKCNPC